jgi:peroxiredoxin
MKKLLPILLMLCFSSAGFSQTKEYKIKMKINGMQDSACFLINYFGKQRYYKDTAQFNSEGVVVFSGKEQHHGGIYGVYTGGKLLFELVINGEAVIDLETDTSDYIKHMKVNKSKENQIFFDHMKFITAKQHESQPLRNKLNSEISDKEKEKVNIQLAAIGKEVNQFRLDVIKKHPDLFVSVIFKTIKEPEAPKLEEVKNDSLNRLFRYEYVKNRYFDEVDFSDARINYTPLYHNKLDKFFKSIVYPNPDSIIKEVDIIVAKAKANDDIFKYTVHHLLSYYERSKIMGMDAVFSHIGLNYYTHELAFWADSTQVEKVQERARKLNPLLIGKTAINLSLLDTSGQKWEVLYKVPSEYTVLVFWDPDCGHCKKELPKLAHFIDSIKTSLDIQVFSVSSHHNEAWKKFIRDNNLDFINVAVPEEVYKDQNKATEYIVKGHTDLKSLNYHTTYDVFTTPQVYLLDKNKKIIGKRLDTPLLKTVLEKEEARKKK